MDTFQDIELPISVGNQSIKVANKSNAVLNNSGLSSQVVLSHVLNMILNSFLLLNVATMIHFRLRRIAVLKHTFRRRGPSSN
jgi:hypothetical protein